MMFDRIVTAIITGYFTFEVWRWGTIKRPSELGDSRVKCCGCVPIEIGIKIIAALTILGTLGLTGFSFYKDLMSTFLPIVCSSALMSIVWIFTFIYDRFWTRRMSFWAYLIFIAILNTIAYAIILY